MTPRRTKRGSVVLTTKQERIARASVTYQLELVLCGKKGCAKQHGPYWYAYWSQGGRVRKRYIGKKFRSLTAPEVHKLPVKTRP